MLKGSIRTRENLSKKFKHLSVKRQDDSINIDKDFIEMEIYSDDGGKEEYNTDNSIYTYMADNIVDIRPESIVAGEAIIIPFRVCTFAMKPFLQYKTTLKNGSVIFDIIRANAGIIPQIEDASYYGKVEGIDKQILMYEVKCTRDNQVNYITSEDSSYWITVHEALNNRHTFGIPVSKEVTSSLTKREELLFLQDDDGVLIETPMIGYRGEYYKKMAFIAGLGMPRSGPYSSLGPYYNFADFTRSLRYACITLNGKPKKVFDNLITRDDTPVFTKGGMVKFVLYLGRTKVMLNRDSDEKDDSHESLKLAEKRPFFKTILRLRDSTGKWASKYDSVIQPLMTVYDPELKRDRELDPQYTIKMYDQQTPIQYAYFNTDDIALNTSTGFYDVKNAKLI